MQWSKVKSILIGILLMVDLFLLCVWVTNVMSSQRRYYETQDNLKQILAENGISWGENMKLPKDSLIPQLGVDISTADELKTVYALLGEDAIKADDTSSLYFESKIGEVRWGNTGEFYALISPDDYKKPKKSDIKQEARILLEQMNMYHSDIKWEIDDMSAYVSFKTAGYDVFNRGITIIFNENSIEIEGRWTFAEPYIEGGSLYSSYNPVDTIVWFSQQNLAKRIDSVTAGLLLNSAAGSQMQLSPVWKIEADTGIYYVDAVKNELVQPKNM